MEQEETRSAMVAECQETAIQEISQKYQSYRANEDDSRYRS